jgi:hypothetical protein
MNREWELSGSARSLDHSQEPSCCNRSASFGHEYVRRCPPLARFTCKRPFLKSICDHRKLQSSLARNPCRYANRIAAASLAPFLPRLRAASIKRSTSFSVRYSLTRYAELGNLLGSVRFTAVGDVSVMIELAFRYGDCGCGSVRNSAGKRTPQTHPISLITFSHGCSLR